MIAFSAFLDAPTLKQLINSGCDGAFEKQNREEFGLLIDIVRKYIAARGEQAIQGKAKGLLGTIHSITDLLREWNLRLESHSQHLVNKKNSTSKDAA